MEINLEIIKKVHFIGIGGIGVSAIARMMLNDGKKVTGSDRSESIITKELAEVGATIFYNQDVVNFSEDTDLIIYTIAIPEDNPELVEAKKKNIPLMTYPQFLGELSKNKFTIAVSGTHGKTTTTAMIAEIMIDAGLDPTVIVGSLLQGSLSKGSNFIMGKSKYLVVEACEYKRSFLNLHPSLVVITNVDNDHLDYYKDLADIQSAFQELVHKEGVLYVVCDSKDENVKPVIDSIKEDKKIHNYKDCAEIKHLKVPGIHNIRNAQAALVVADILKIDQTQAEQSLQNFSGTWRRFEYKGKTKLGTLVYDDYGHHPTEVKATLQGARELFPDKKIVVVFQPHLYSRTKDHLVEFGASFKQVDEVVLAPIYAAREALDPSISSEMLAQRIVEGGGKAQSFRDFADIEKYLETNDAQVIITMGAGDIYRVGESLL